MLRFMPAAHSQKSRTEENKNLKMPYEYHSENGFLISHSSYMVDINAAEASMVHALKTRWCVDHHFLKSQLKLCIYFKHCILNSDC